MPALNSDAPAFAAAKAVSSRLAQAGFRSALVGGAVRDMLLGRTPADFDLVTTARPEDLQKIFPEAKLVGASFGVVIIRENGIDMEVATARSERTYLDGRHPENISYTTDFSLDAKRRDFTVNALMYDLENNELLDYNNGVDDLQRGILRTVGDPAERFKEDYLRILRAVRFAAKLGFTLDEQLESALKTHSGLVSELSCERIFSELDMMLTGRSPARAIKLLEETGILAHILPEVAILRQITQPPQFHPEGDVLEHTLLMLSRMPLSNRRLAWSVLLHDVGKAATRSVDANGRIRFFGHESKGAEIAEAVCRRLRMPIADMESCIHAVTNHMRYASVTAMKTAKLRKLIGEADFAMELELHRLDCLCSNGLMDGFNFLLDTMNIYSGSEKALPPPFVRGKDLVACGIAPQVRFKKVLETIYDRQLAGEFENKNAALTAALEMFNREN